MGGPGSGNHWRCGTRGVCEENKRIDIRYMRQHGMLRPGSAGSLSWSRGGESTGRIGYRTYQNSLFLDYSYRQVGEEEWTPIREHVSIDSVEQPYGGYRRYFLCPRCYRRCLVLYGGSYFRCRKCQNLAYASQNADALDRLRRKAERLRAKLGGKADIWEPYPDKPKGMHWKTYNRICDELNYLESEWDAGLALMAGKLSGLF